MVPPKRKAPRYEMLIEIGSFYNLILCPAFIATIFCLKNLHYFTGDKVIISYWQPISVRKGTYHPEAPLETFNIEEL